MAIPDERGFNRIKGHCNLGILEYSTPVGKQEATTDPGLSCKRDHGDERRQIRQIAEPA